MKKDNAVREARAIARFEITYDPDIGMIHRPHDHGYYVRYEDHATALAAKNAELAMVRDNLGALLIERSEIIKQQIERAERAEAQLAEANKALDAVFDDTQARTKAGMTYGINGHPTLSPATLNVVAQARFAARRAREQGGE